MNRSVMARLQFIHDRIRGGHYPNATNLARELEVSRSTVQRDIEFSLFGIPCEVYITILCG